MTRIITVRQTDGRTERDYTKYAIEYESDVPLSELTDIADLPGPAQDKGGTIYVADDETRDMVHNVCEEHNITYKTTDAAPSDQEKRIIEREGVTNDRDATEAIQQLDSVVDRELVSQASRDELATAINNVDDADTQSALAVLYEVLTGEELPDPTA